MFFSHYISVICANLFSNFVAVFNNLSRNHNIKSYAIVSMIVNMNESYFNQIPQIRISDPNGQKWHSYRLIIINSPNANNEISNFSWRMRQNWRNWEVKTSDGWTNLKTIIDSSGRSSSTAQLHPLFSLKFIGGCCESAWVSAKSTPVCNFWATFFELGVRDELFVCQFISHVIIVG